MVERFLAGVLLEDEGSTSNNFALQLVRVFATGVPGLPREGMQAFMEKRPPSWIPEDVTRPRR